MLHVSDLHDKDFGARFEAIAGRCEAFRPDAVCITGDLIDTGDMERRSGSCAALRALRRFTTCPATMSARWGPRFTAA